MFNSIRKKLAKHGKSASNEAGPSHTNGEVTRPKARKSIIWPPEVVGDTPLGVIHDIHGNWNPRDIGRSSEIGGDIFFQFGDTFAHSSNGEFIGVTSNTVSVVSERDFPVMADNLKSSPWGIADFIELFSDEIGNPNEVYKIWSFGGIVECARRNDSVYGWTWYEMRKGPDNGVEPELLYVGVAQIRYLVGSRGKKIAASRNKVDRALFQPSEPQLGSFCAVADGDIIYVYGHRTFTSKDVVMGRVKRHLAYDKKQYQYKRTNGDWTAWGDASAEYKTIFENMQQGQIFQTTMFGPGSEYGWAFIGCTSFGDSKIMMGRARAPDGPWEIETLASTYTTLSQPGPFTYCMYVHPWASNEKKGDLCVSWSEGTMRGGVLAHMFRLKQVSDTENDVEGE